MQGKLLCAFQMDFIDLLLYSANIVILQKQN